MAHLKEVVDRISLIAFTQQITKAMKVVSASKLHKIQQILLPLKGYTTQYSKLLHIMLSNRDNQDLFHPLMEKNMGKGLLLIVVSSNRGLCGAFNKNLLRAADQYILARQKNEGIRVDVVVIGKKAHQFFKKSPLSVIDIYTDVLDQPYHQASAALTAYCIESFEKNDYSEMALAYTAFNNAAKQEVVITPFLPFLPDLGVDFTQSITGQHHYIYEPSPALLIAQLIPAILKNKIMHMLVESSASEHAARMATMTQATDNADELLKLLRISYNRTRQALITSSLAEIISGAEALAES